MNAIKSHKAEILKIVDEDHSVIFLSENILAHANMELLISGFAREWIK